jgi:hypothetical protein
MTSKRLRLLALILRNRLTEDRCFVCGLRDCVHRKARRWRKAGTSPGRIILGD